MHTFLRSLFAGVLGGVLVVAIVAHSPRTQRLFGFSGGGAVPAVEQDSGVGADSAMMSAAVAYEEAVVAAVERANPAVVSIVVSKDVPIIERFYEDIPATPFSPFGDFFGDRFSRSNPKLSSWMSRSPALTSIRGSNFKMRLGC